MFYTKYSIGAKFLKAIFLTNSKEKLNEFKDSLNYSVLTKLLLDAKKKKFNQMTEYFQKQIIILSRLKKHLKGELEDHENDPFLINGHKICNSLIGLLNNFIMIIVEANNKFNEENFTGSYTNDFIERIYINLTSIDDFINVSREEFHKIIMYYKNDLNIYINTEKDLMDIEDYFEMNFP